MNRRDFLKLSAGAGTLLPMGNSFGGTIYDSSRTIKKLVVGIGSAGCRIVSTFKNHRDFERTGCTVYAVDWKNADNSVFQHWPEHQKISLGSKCPFANNVKDILQIKRILLEWDEASVVDPLLPIVDKADSVLVVAGLGGTTGSWIGPTLTKVLMKMDKPRFAIWVRPMEFENNRHAFYGWLVNNIVLGHTSCQLPSSDHIWKKFIGQRMTLAELYKLTNQWIVDEMLLKQVTRTHRDTIWDTYP